MQMANRLCLKCDSISPMCKTECDICGFPFEPPAVVRELLDKRVSIDMVDVITKARGSVYGPFLHNSIVAQAIKAAMRNIPDPDNLGQRWEALPLDVREGLDLIALKISRIVTGDPEYLDNWDDIGGYAKIVADRIRKAKG